MFNFVFEKKTKKGFSGEGVKLLYIDLFPEKKNKIYCLTILSLLSEQRAQNMVFKIKKTAILLFLCLLTVIAESKVVTIPLYIQRNLIRIDKLEMSLEETALHCVFRTLYSENSRGGISSKSYLRGESGKIYKIIGSEGIALDEQIYSYEPLKIVLHFEPLDENEKIIHFFEMSKENSNYSLFDIYTYKPESVKPFICTIKGQVVGFDCERISLSVAENFNRMADYESIPVIDGKFEFSKEYNFIELYNISPVAKYPTTSKGEFSLFYISEGVINIVFNSRDSKKGNEISGGFSENESYLTLNYSFTDLVQSDSSIYKQYYENVEYADNRWPPFGLIPLFHKSQILQESNGVSPKYISELKKLQDLVYTAENYFDMDSLLMEMGKIKQSPDFYKDGIKSIIVEKDEADKRNIERLAKILTENPSVPKFYELTSLIISSIIENYPLEVGFRYKEDKGRTFIFEHYIFSSKEKADEQLNMFLKIYEDIYKPIMQHHRLDLKISDGVKRHNERIEQATRFFDACSKIDLTSSIKTLSDKGLTPTVISANSNGEANGELEKLRDLIAKTIIFKDNRATEIINLFATDYLPKYPNHEITNEIKRMIRISSDDQNPNKWKNAKYLPDVNDESFKASIGAAIEYLNNKQ